MFFSLPDTRDLSEKCDFGDAIDFRLRLGDNDFSFIDDFLDIVLYYLIVPYIVLCLFELATLYFIVSS